MEDMMLDPHPGDAVRFTLTFSGVVTRVRGDYVTIRTKRGEYAIDRRDVVGVIDARPNPAEVVRLVRCPGCGRVAGAACVHKQSGRPIKHPHIERVDLYIQVTGWSADEHRRET